MRKMLLGLFPALLALAAFEVHARYIPYVAAPVPVPVQKITPSEYDKNTDSYITADEVEVELREDAIDKVAEMYKKGKSQKEIDQVILDMEDSIEQDAEVIIDKLDTDGDELVEPEEYR